MNPPSPHVWPDSLDATATIVFLTAAVAIPALGYVFLVLDVRRYLRSLRRAISTILQRSSDAPEWYRPEVPRCVAVFDLTWPCSEEELLSAYRAKIKRLHPDRGGDARRFLALQRYFEEAQQMARRHAAGQ